MIYKPTALKFSLLLFSVVLLLAACLSTGRWSPLGLGAQETAKPDPKADARYRSILKSISQDRISQTMKYLSGPEIGSRMVGYPGSVKAGQYVEDQFKAIGLQDISVQTFDVTVPVDKGSSIQIGGKTLKLNALWPNMVRTSSVAPEGVSGPLAYIGQARLQDMRNQQLKDAIAVVDFNCGNNWINAVRSGARAVIFLQPETTMRGEAEAKFMSIPVNVPRFMAGASESASIKAASTSNQMATVKSSMPWVKAKGRNILAKIEGTDPKLKDQIIILSAYYDAISVAPNLAPGAETSSSIAGLLELARTYKKHPPKRSVWILATDGHFQGLAGIRTWMDANFDEFTRPGVGERISGFFNRTIGVGSPIRKRKDVYLFCGLDLSTQSEGVGIFYKGYFYNVREDIKGRFSDLATVARENSTRIAELQGRNAEQAFADGVNDIGGKNWRNYLPGKIAFDAEAVSVGGGSAVTFSTLNDSRALVDTPFDTFQNANPENVGKQVKMVACIIDHYLNDPTQTGRLSKDMFPVKEPNAFQRIGIQGGFAEVGGQVVEYNPGKSFVPNQPVGGAIAVLRSASRSYMGVRANLMQNTDSKGHFRFVGIGPVTAGVPNQSLAAFVLDPDNGNIKYAPDQGVFGGEFNYSGFEVATSSKNMPVIVFPCVASTVFDLVDPQSLKALGGLRVLDGSTNGAPRRYGTAVAVPEAMVSHIEDGAVIFTEPNQRIKLIMDAGPAATRLLLLNNKATGVMSDAEGSGYDVGNGTILTSTSYKAARDMWILNEARISRLAKYRIINQGINSLHASAKKELDTAEKALEQKNFEVFEAASRSSWGLSARAYPDVQKTAEDVVKGVLFYMALLLPFAFFIERLFFGFPELTKQLVTFFLIFILVVIGFSRIHPAFDITLNPVIVILAFIMMVLSAMVIVLVSGKFEEMLRNLNRQVSGVHKVDIGRISVAAAAFSLGVSNMRRRKVRTVLTCVSLILVTFIVLSFTSIVNEIKFNARPTKGKPTYQGIMLRTAMWEPLQETAYRVLNDEFGASRDVAPRVWFMGTNPGEQSSLTVSNGGKKFDAKAAMGLSAEEMNVTNPHKALIAGRWFKGDEFQSIILPDRMAKELGVTSADVGKVKVRFGGVGYNVIGILDSKKFRNIKDLDGEPLTPVDFILMNKQQGGQNQNMAEAGFREYTHMDPDTVFVLPYKTLVGMGGELRSVAINFVSPEEVQNKLDTLMRRLGLNLYAGKGETIFRYSSIGGSSTAGFATIWIPILIAGLSVLKTMLDSVYERVKEIGIFSSIGLSPGHIAVLFFAEATVYGILGAVSGYLIGQAVSKILAETGYLAGLTLNFSSTSAVMSTMLVMIVVWLSTFYPARKASQVATPAIDRSWKVPEPDGDNWVIPLPFSVTGAQASGVNSFLGEWFRAYEEYSVGDFVTQDVQEGEIDTQYGKGYTLACKAWLAPFDLGVSQSVNLETVPTDMEDVYEIHVILGRESGDISNWKRVNRRFLNTLRKQFLIWRTLSAEDRDKYLSVDAQSAPAATPPTGAAPEPA